MLLSPGCELHLCITALGIYWGSSSPATGPHTFIDSPVPSSHLPRALPITFYSPCSAWKMAFFQIWEASNKGEKKNCFFMFNSLFSNHNNQLKGKRLLAISPRGWSQTEKNRLCIAALAPKSASCEWYQTTCSFGCLERKQWLGESSSLILYSSGSSPERWIICVMNK